jgi:SAM-dependent methyltransferase
LVQSWRSSTAGPEIDPKRIVRDGYDRISYEYRDDAGRGASKEKPGERKPSTGYAAWLAELTPSLDDGDPVLDLGCGCGVPATAILAERFSVTGVDISPVQIERARRLVPAATFLWLKEGGFEVLWTRFIPERDSGHTLLLAQRAPTLPSPASGEGN